MTVSCYEDFDCVRTITNLDFHCCFGYCLYGSGLNAEHGTKHEAKRGTKHGTELTKMRSGLSKMRNRLKYETD